MTADSIARLSQKLLASPLADKGSVWLSSETFAEQSLSVAPKTANQLASFFRELRELVPTDFSFVMIFTFQGVELSFEFDDSTTSSNVPDVHFFTSHKSLRKRLRHLPWDEYRQAAIEGAGVLDELLNAAEDRPVAIPSSEAAATACRGELEGEIARVRAGAPLPKFALIIRQNGTIETSEQPSRDSVILEISNCLSTDCEILAVLERGVRWPFDELEEAKQESINGLRPETISRAKAEGRFLV